MKIANILNISPEMVRGWKNKDKWKNIKDDFIDTKKYINEDTEIIKQSNLFKKALT